MAIPSIDPRRKPVNGEATMATNYAVSGRVTFSTLDDTIGTSRVLKNSRTRHGTVRRLVSRVPPVRVKGCKRLRR